MSGIYGWFRRSGGAAGDILPMQSLYEQWFRDGQGQRHFDQVALGHTLLWNTPESRLESMPRQEGEDGQRLCITAQVRLDNREELAAALGVGCPLASVTDSELLLAAYRRWGENSPVHLLGDFAFALWDESRQHLFCARDHVGVASLYYACDERDFVFANHVHAITAAKPDCRSYDEEAIGIYLSEGELYSTERTLYARIRQLPPASTLTVSASGLHIRRYWCLADAPTREPGSLEDCSVRMRDLLEKSVACRLRSAYPVSAHLTGGLDSSAIVALAAPILARRGETLSTYNWNAGPGGNPDPYEREWSLGKAFARQLGVGHHFLSFTPDSMGRVLVEHDLTSMDTADLWYERDVRQLMRDAGSRTMLSGWGGDHVVSSHGDYALYDLFWHRDPVEALRLAWAAGSDAPSTLRRFLGYVYRLIIRPAFAGCGDEAGFEADPWLNLQYYAQAHVSLRQGAQSVVNSTLQRLTVRDDMLEQYSRGHLHNRLTSWAAGALSSGMEYRYPLLDKRLLEFALSLPPEYLWRMGYGRYLFRYALRDILPEAICWANLKQEPGRVARWAQVGSEALAHWLARGGQQVSHSHYVDVDRIGAGIRRLQRESLSPDQRLDLTLALTKAVLLARL